MGYELVCDLCGKKITGNDKLRIFKIKERKCFFTEVFWTRIDAHDKCVKELLLARNRKKEENTDD